MTVSNSIVSHLIILLPAWCILVLNASFSQQSYNFFIFTGLYTLGLYRVNANQNQMKSLKNKLLINNADLSIDGKESVLFLYFACFTFFL